MNHRKAPLGPDRGWIAILFRSLLTVATASAVAACGSTDVDVVSTLIRVTTLTRALNPSYQVPEGYGVLIDGSEVGTVEAVLPAPSIEVELTAGSHSISVSGVPADCGVVGPDPRTVAITTDDIITIEVECVVRLRNQEIAFTALGDNGASYLFLVGSDGSNLLGLERTDLPPTLHYYAGPNHVTWSSDGSKLYFEHGGDVYTSDPDFTDLEPILILSNGDAVTGALDVAPSPDGSQLAVTKVDGHPADIWVVTLSTGEAVDVTDPTAIDTDPEWSPDGTRIAFASDPDGGGSLIFTMDPDGSNLVRLSNSVSGDSRPSWSPDGQTIAVQANGLDGGIDLLRVDGSDRTSLMPGEILDWDPTWSPDGTKILFTNAKTAGAGCEIIGVDGSDRHVVVDSVPLPYIGGCLGPDWRPPA